MLMIINKKLAKFRIPLCEKNASRKMFEIANPEIYQHAEKKPVYSYKG